MLAAEEILLCVALVLIGIVVVACIPSDSGQRPVARPGAVDAFCAIPDQYHTIGDVQLALREAGLESSQLIVGVDYTRSNEWTGKRTFEGCCLHDVGETAESTHTPYSEVIRVMGETLQEFDEDGLVPAYGFGDERTKGVSVFPFAKDDRPCKGIGEVLELYCSLTPRVKLSGPTSFTPLIRQAMDIIKRDWQYHILLIVTDGDVSDGDETGETIVAASSYPLSIVAVGVGDGPFSLMEEYDDLLPKRRFDNFQFVDFSRTNGARDPKIAFAVAALQEIPDQYAAIKRLGLLTRPL